MPIYEYSCSKCDETIEAIQRLADPPLKKHQGCGGTLTKLLSVPTVKVKEVDPFRGSKHPSALQQGENEKKAAERQRKTAPIVSAPSRRKAKSSK